jgi:hypothetical protein
VKRAILLAATTGVIAGISFFPGSPARLAAAAATPPPTPPPIGTPATPGQPPISTPATAGPSTSFPLPLASATPAAKGKPTPTPPPNARKGLNGVWEVQIQHPSVTDYTHFQVTQEGDALTGVYLDARGKKYPIAGTVDGQAIRLIVTMPNGTTLLLEGKLDGTTDMVGMLTSPDGQVPFTAAYRAKEKWIENVNPSPGGIGQPGSYTPP